jgi:hypothetical protein
MENWSEDAITQLRTVGLLEGRDVVPSDVVLDFHELLPPGSSEIVVVPRKKLPDTKVMEEWMQDNGFCMLMISRGGSSLLFVSRDEERIAAISAYVIDSVPQVDKDGLPLFAAGV